MIQRIQTVYLLAVVLAECLMLFMPWVEYAAGGIFDVFRAFCFDEDCTGSGAVNPVPLTIGLVVSILLTVYAITRFKNRKFQMLLVRWNMLALVVSIGAFATMHYFAIQAMRTFGALTMSYRWVVVLPLITLVLLWLALKAIRRDEDLVRSMDRIR